MILTTRALFLFFLLLSATSATEAGRAKAWQQHAYDDFAAGESEGISIAADGALELAPVHRKARLRAKDLDDQFVGGTRALE